MIKCRTERCTGTPKAVTKIAEQLLRPLSVPSLKSARRPVIAGVMQNWNDLKKVARVPPAWFKKRAQTHFAEMAFANEILFGKSPSSALPIKLCGRSAGWHDSRQAFTKEFCITSRIDRA